MNTVRKRKPGPGRPRTSPEKRFWSKVEITPGCWNWTDNPTPSGYGRLGTDGKHTMAHRFSWELHIGKLDKGEILDHICHNRLCVNPAHLRLSTVAKNNQNLRGAYRNSGTGVRGVSRSKSGRYEARVIHNKVFMHLGTYDSLIEAEKVALAKRIELFEFNPIDHARAVELGIITDTTAREVIKNIERQAA